MAVGFLAKAANEPVVTRKLPLGYHLVEAIGEPVDRRGLKALRLFARGEISRAKRRKRYAARLPPKPNAPRSHGEVPQTAY